MPKSREELRRELQATLGLGDTPKAAKPVAKSVGDVAKPAANGKAFSSRFRVAAEVADVAEDNTAIAVEDEPVQPAVEDCGDEPESTPAAELASKLSDLLDFLADNRDSIKSFLESLQ